MRDAIEQNGDPQGRIVMRYDYDMLGNRIHQASMEAGERWMLNDVAGNPIYAWDSRGHAFRSEYDPLRRPLRSFVTGADPANPNQELLTERLVYGEQHPEDELRNLRGKLYLRLDQAGVVTNETHDFKGNLLRASRRLAREYKQALNWSAVDAALPVNGTTKLAPAAVEAALASRLEVDIFTGRTTYDALNRPVQLIPPRSDQPGGKRYVIQPGYNEANLLERIHVWLDHPAEPDGLLDAATVPPSLAGVNNIDYDAKGQRLRIEYKNGATTKYKYDTETFRLIHLYTRRGATFTEDCENPQPPPLTIAAPEKPPHGKSCGLQNLHYTYDPVGNITHIRDDAQQTIYFRNRRVEPSAKYTYDAVYRLIDATGREHLGQVGGQPRPPTAPDAFNQFHIRQDHPGDGNAMGTYVEQYVYDAVGNTLAMQHRGTDPVHAGWTRAYAYDEISQLEPGKANNRLSRTTVGATTENYRYDGPAGLHGNITRMPHLPLMQWDYRDQLQAGAQQVVNNGTPETTWYVYDAGGQRARKVTERQAAAGQTPARKAERTYLGSFEIYREYNGDGSTVTLERETLHITDDQQRIALVETRTQGNDGSPAQLIRYQLSNHLGSASLELDDQAKIISYEEYTPYGSTSYQAVRSGVEVSSKRYRYTGKERDEETGFYYHGARDYAPWLGRWTSCDPAGMVDGANLYSTFAGNPVSFVDPTGTISQRDVKDAGLAFAGVVYGVGKAAFKAVILTPLKAGYYVEGFAAYHVSGDETYRDQADVLQQGYDDLKAVIQSGPRAIGEAVFADVTKTWHEGVEKHDTFLMGSALGELGFNAGVLTDLVQAGAGALPNGTITPTPALATANGIVIAGGGRVAITAGQMGPLLPPTILLASKTTQDIIAEAEKHGETVPWDTAVEFAKERGIKIPKDVEFVVDKSPWKRRDAWMSYAYDKKDVMTWQDFYTGQGKIRVTVNPEVLYDIGRTLRSFKHELYEIEGLRKAFQETPEMRYDQVQQQIETLHQQAVKKWGEF